MKMKSQTNLNTDSSTAANKKKFNLPVLEIFLNRQMNILKRKNDTNNKMLEKVSIKSLAKKDESIQRV